MAIQKTNIDIILPYTMFEPTGESAVQRYEKLEIEYAVASIIKYCGTWVNRIFVVGSFPQQLEKYGNCIHIPCNDPFTHCKDANIINKIKTVILSVPDLSDDFIVWSDDQVVTHNVVFDDFIPRVGSDYRHSPLLLAKLQYSSNQFSQQMYKTLKRFPGKEIRWEPHIPSPFNKTKFMKMCETFRPDENDGVVIFSLYYNFIGQKTVGHFSHLCVRNYNHINTLKRTLPTFIGWFDNAFRTEDFRKLLDEIVFDIPYENKSYTSTKKNTYKKINRVGTFIQRRS